MLQRSRGHVKQLAATAFAAHGVPGTPLWRSAFPRVLISCETRHFASLEPKRSKFLWCREIWDSFIDRSVAATPTRVVALAAQLLFWPTLWWNRFRHTGADTQWYNEIADGILLGALPDAALAHHLAAHESVSAVLNMVGEWEGPVDAYSSLGIAQLWLPVVDFTSPTVEDLECGVDWLLEQTGQGKRVYVHCKAGKGRSGTVVMAYLMRTRQLSPAQAQELLLSKRSQVLTSLSTRVEVEGYYDRHVPGKK